MALRCRAAKPRGRRSLFLLVGRRGKLHVLCSERVEMIDAHAEVVAQMLLGCCEERAPIFLKALVGDPEALVQGELLAPLTAELLVLALHLTDRTVFGRFGADARSTFMDELLPLVRSKLISPLEEKFPDLYNTRTGFYGSFQKAVPGKNENLKAHH